MGRLDVKGVTYVGGHPSRPEGADGLTLRLDRARIEVLQSRRRRFLSVPWLDLRGLDVRTPSAATLITTGLSAAADPLLEVDADAGTFRFRVAGTTPHGLRAMLASWAVAEAGPQEPWPAGSTTPGPPVQGVGTPLEAAERALGATRAASLGREPLYDRSTLRYRVDVAENYRLTGRHLEALALLVPLVTSAAEAFGPDDRETFAARDALGQAYLAAGAVDEGTATLADLVAAAERTLGTDADDTLIFRNNLAMAHQRAGRYAEAIALHEQNVAYTEARHGSHRADTIGRMSNLAGTLAFAGRRERAISVYWRVLDVGGDALGPTHPHVRNARVNLAVLHNPTWGP